MLFVVNSYSALSCKSILQTMPKVLIVVNFD